MDTKINNSEKCSYFAAANTVTIYFIKRNGKNRKKVYKHRYFYFGSKKSENIEVFWLFLTEI